MNAADFRCQHCAAPLGHSPRDNPAKAVISGTVVVKDGRAETRCRSCGQDTVLPLVFVAVPPPPKVNSGPTLTVRRRIAR